MACATVSQFSQLPGYLRPQDTRHDGKGSDSWCTSTWEEHLYGGLTSAPPRNGKNEACALSSTPVGSTKVCIYIVGLFSYLLLFGRNMSSQVKIKRAVVAA